MKIALLILTVLFLLVSYYCIKFALIIINMQNSLEEALDKIDTKYNRLTQVLEIPVFFDSPEIKSIIQEVQGVQDVVLSLASDLSNAANTKKESKEE